MLGAGVVNHGDAVVGFAFAFAVLPCAVACAAQVGQVAVKAHLREAFGGGLDDFVGEGAALGGVGVVNHGNAAFCTLGGQVEGFQIADGAVDLDKGGLCHLGFPLCLCD